MVDASQGGPVRILMLEDSPLDAELATNRLRRADLEPVVTLVSDRLSFEKALEAGEYDVILADYALPDFDGISALAIARELRPNVPFIFISGRVGEEVAIDTLQRGATDYVLKHRLERLVPAVLRALRESREHVTRMQAEARFRQSELRFRHVIDAVPQMIWVSTPSGRLTYSNQLWNEYAAADVESWCSASLIHPEDYEEVYQSWRRAVERSEPFTCEMRFLRSSDHSWRWHLLRVTPMDYDPELPSGQEIQWLGAATDLQDQKRNEEALRTADKLAVTGRMAAAIAHEINNPLESLTNLIFLVRMESENNPAALRYLEMTDNELARISAITKQTLQFYRDPLLPVSVDAREIVEEVLRLFATRFTSKSIQTTVQIEQNLIFQAIKGEIRQVLINLINNAIDAVPSQGRIDVEAASAALNGKPVVEIIIHDNGSGISPKEREHLFQPFFSTKGAHGTGLGLWVSKGIIEKHGGSLRLSSENNRTSARIKLPTDVVPALLRQEREPN